MELKSCVIHLEISLNELESCLIDLEISLIELLIEGLLLVFAIRNIFALLLIVGSRFLTAITSFFLNKNTEENLNDNNYDILLFMSCNT